MANNPSPITLTFVHSYTVFRKTEEYQLTRLMTIQVTYWYAAREGEECILLGPIERIPGNTSQPLTYEEARELANKINKPSSTSELILKKEDNECFR